MRSPHFPAPCTPAGPLPRIPTVVLSPPANPRPPTPLHPLVPARRCPLPPGSRGARSPRPPRTGKNPRHGHPAPPRFLEASEEGTSHRPLPTPGVPFGSRWPGPAPPRGNIPKKVRKENSESSWPIGEDRRVRWEKWGGGRAPGKERERRKWGEQTEPGGGGSTGSRVGVGVGRAPWPAGLQPRGKYAGHVGGGAGGSGEPGSGHRDWERTDTRLTDARPALGGSRPPASVSPSTPRDFATTFMSR